MNPKDPIVLTDIGNSRIKLKVDSKSFPAINENAPFEIGLPPHPHQWFICSVSPSETQRLTQWISRERPNDSVHKITHSDVPLQIKLQGPTQVGLDRLMAATAATQKLGGGDLVVIDAGTAVTIDAVSNGNFLGGTISPGSQTEFEALREKAEQLPLINEYQLPENAIGKSTCEAIQSGVLLGQAGSITHIARMIAAELHQPKIVATGGGLVPIRKLLPDDWTYANDLVLDGIAIVAKRVLDSRESS